MKLCDFLLSEVERHPLEAEAWISAERWNGELGYCKEGGALWICFTARRSDDDKSKGLGPRQVGLVVSCWNGELGSRFVHSFSFFSSTSLFPTFSKTTLPAHSQPSLTSNNFVLQSARFPQLLEERLGGLVCLKF